MHYVTEFISIILGVFIKWIYYGGTKSYSEIENEKNTIKVGRITFIIICVIIILIYYSEK